MIILRKSREYLPAPAKPSANRANILPISIALPSGEDFLSPCLGEADLIRRLLPTEEFARWLRGFMPQIAPSGDDNWLQPVVSPDPSDPKLAHMDGLNLSRAWMLEGIAAGLPKGDNRLPSITAAAVAHRQAGLAAVTGQHYEGGHWLGSFAVYLVRSEAFRKHFNGCDYPTWARWLDRRPLAVGSQLPDSPNIVCFRQGCVTACRLDCYVQSSAEVGRD